MVFIQGTNNSERIDNPSSNGTVYLGGGNDVFEIGNGNDTVSGGSGNGSITAKGYSSDSSNSSSSVFGESGDDIIRVLRQCYF